MERLSKIVDVLFNGRPADNPPRSRSVNMDELIRRKSSVVLYEGKTYRVIVSEVRLTKSDKP